MEQRFYGFSIAIGSTMPGRPFSRTSLGVPDSLPKISYTFLHFYVKTGTLAVYSSEVLKPVVLATKPPVLMSSVHQMSSPR